MTFVSRKTFVYSTDRGARIFKPATASVSGESNHLYDSKTEIRTRQLGPHISRPQVARVSLECRAATILATRSGILFGVAHTGKQIPEFETWGSLTLAMGRITNQYIADNILGFREISIIFK